MEEERPKRMALIASQGTLDWAYPPFILASTAVAMEMQVAVFFTFYGLTLLKRKITAKVAPHANPAMPMKMPFGPKSFQNFEWPMPNMLMGNLPGFETTATSLMKQTFKNKEIRGEDDRLSDDNGRLRFQQGGFYRWGRSRRGCNLSGIRSRFRHPTVCLKTVCDFIQMTVQDTIP